MQDYAPGPIACKGAFTGEFGLGDELDFDEAPYVIERDRINEGKLPGFNRKLLPLQIDEVTHRRTAGMSAPGRLLEEETGATRTFDRTSWVFSIWFPYPDRFTARRTRWPNSPPFPGL